MTPSARLQATIEILEGLNAGQMPADRYIRDYFRARRYAGSKDRAAIAERVFQIMRHRASYGWRMRGGDPRRLAIASVLAEGGDPGTLFTGEHYAPAALDPDEQSALASPPAEDMPDHIRAEVPEFLVPELQRAFGEDWPDEMEAMQARAPIDLRANTLKAARADVRDRLAALGLDAAPAPHAPYGLRLDPATNAASLNRSDVFAEGLFEFQDEAAQIAAALCQAQPGMRVLDLAAGAGGKALALAAAMRNTGEIVASDISAARLHQIAPRAARAGITIVTTVQSAALKPDGAFDLVLVDAPCSGTGTWRRQPESKWRLTPDRLAGLVAVQDRLLKTAAAHLRPGGRLIYATCSVLRSENDDRIAGFLAQHPEFSMLSARDAWQGPPVPGLESVFRTGPKQSQMDGFYAAILVHDR